MCSEDWTRVLTLGRLTLAEPSTQPRAIVFWTWTIFSPGIAQRPKGALCWHWSFCSMWSCIAVFLLLCYHASCHHQPLSDRMLHTVLMWNSTTQGFWLRMSWWWFVLGVHCTWTVELVSLPELAKCSVMKSVPLGMGRSRATGSQEEMDGRILGTVLWVNCGIPQVRSVFFWFNFLQHWGLHLGNHTC